MGRGASRHDAQRRHHRLHRRCLPLRLAPRLYVAHPTLPPPSCCTLIHLSLSRREGDEKRWHAAAWLGSQLMPSKSCSVPFASILETVHAATGLVRSGLVAPLVQWVGRSFVLFAVVGRTPALHTHAALFVLLAVWCCSEVIRYPQYALSLLGTCPRALTWLRYSAFIPLYPIGMFGGEMVLIYSALPFVKAERPLDFLFAALPFHCHHVLMVILAAYPLFWLHLYTHMFRQRRSKLHPKSHKGSKKPHKAMAIVPMSPEMFAQTTPNRPAAAPTSKGAAPIGPSSAAAAATTAMGGGALAAAQMHGSDVRLRAAGSRRSGSAVAEQQ
ncbi:unnamed protein product [Closterium sp. Yama58-4]|nr:unnamed protein product [Closterium sp. Yama58-4]